MAKPKLEHLLSHGLLPRELPRCFTSRGYAAIATQVQAPPHRRGGRAAVRHSIGRPGDLRRLLSIPHPLSHLETSREITAIWKEIKKHCNKSNMSLSRLALNHDGRAIAPRTSFGTLAHHRTSHRRLGRYALQADVSQFYNSIYTHSISWALASRHQAKAAIRTPRRTKPLIGDRLDKAIRDGQEQQTIGIPTGPDTSLVVAEIILTAVDVELQGRLSLPPGGAFRFMDDFEIIFSTRADAEDALGVLEAELYRYQLTLNQSKTNILELPHILEESWRTILHQFRIRTDSDTKFSNDLISFFSFAFALRVAHPTKAVLTYAIQKAGRLPLSKITWPTYLDLAAAAVQSEPSALGKFCSIVEDGVRQGSLQDLEVVEAVMNAIIVSHAPREHGLEVCWSLWTLAVLGLSLDELAESKAGEMSDNACLILLMHLQELRSSTASSQPALPYELESKEELPHSENWLLAYECTRHGWIR